MSHFLMALLLSLGKHGHTFPVEEEDFVSYLKSKVRDFSHAELERYQGHFLKEFHQPKSVEGLHEATEYTVHFFDPTIKVKKGINAHDGTCVIPAGTSFNPLTRYSLTTHLLFFDAANAAHVAWAKRQDTTARWILVCGHPLDLEKAENRPVYFDQGGFLTKKLALQTIPARVSQEDLKLKIEEIPIDEEGCEQY